MARRVPAKKSGEEWSELARLDHDPIPATCEQVSSQHAQATPFFTFDIAARFHFHLISKLGFDFLLYVAAFRPA
jgi:hypothetical protein